MKEKFEKWIHVQFKGKYDDLLLDFDDDKYGDPIVNAVWVAFVAGAMLGSND